MKIMRIDEFRKKWDDNNTAKKTYQRIDDTHQLDFYVGENELGYKELLLITELEPSKMKSSKSVEVEKGKRADQKWAIRIKLTNPEYEDVFIHLCWDLIESSRSCQSELLGIEMVISRFSKWQKLMANGNEGLSNEVIKGIIGELTYAELVLLEKYDLDTIISSWLGPDGADRDFIFQNTWTEVKAIGSGRTSIGISSLEQLDIDIEGTIAVATIDNTSPLDNAGFNFTSKISKFRELMQASPDALFKFEEKLINIGYYDRKEYDEKFYTFEGFKFFKVDKDFPKLNKKNVRSEIIAAEYEISLSAIANWELEV